MRDAAMMRHLCSPLPDYSCRRSPDWPRRRVSALFSENNWLVEPLPLKPIR